MSHPSPQEQHRLLALLVAVVVAVELIDYPVEQYWWRPGLVCFDLLRLFVVVVYFLC